MQSNQDKNLFEYAVVRYLPRVEREEFMNIGLVMMCKRRRWIKTRLDFDESRLRAFAPRADVDALRGQLEAFSRVAAGCPGAIGELEPHERFRWLTAVRSACLSTSRPHPGLTDDLDATFDRLYGELVASER
ncbi:MAG: DUF3037 domain-containing protein [Bacteroides sp.]|nr:DUF3037 domain-containing protein [Bacteroides sp.]